MLFRNSLSGAIVRPLTSGQVRPISKLATNINKIFASVFVLHTHFVTGVHLEGTNILLN